MIRLLFVCVLWAGCALDWSSPTDDGLDVVEQVDEHDVLEAEVVLDTPPELDESWADDVLFVDDAGPAEVLDEVEVLEDVGPEAEAEAVSPVMYHLSPVYSSAAWPCSAGVEWEIHEYGFLDDGLFLVVTGAPCDMVGVSASSSGSINVSCSMSTAICRVVFTLSAAYNTIWVDGGPAGWTTDAWSGQFDVTFPGLCGDCSTGRSGALTGARE